MRFAVFAVGKIPGKHYPLKHVSKSLAMGWLGITHKRVGPAHIAEMSKDECLEAKRLRTLAEELERNRQIMSEPLPPLELPQTQFVGPIPPLIVSEFQGWADWARGVK